MTVGRESYPIGHSFSSALATCPPKQRRTANLVAGGMVSGAADGHGRLTRITPGRTLETCTASDTTSTAMPDHAGLLPLPKRGEDVPILVDREGLPALETQGIMAIGFRLRRGYAETSRR